MLEQMPNSEKVEFKEEFLKRYSALTDFSEYRRCSLSFPRKSIRVNTLKIKVTELVSEFEKKMEINSCAMVQGGIFCRKRKARHW